MNTEKYHYFTGSLVEIARKENRFGISELDYSRVTVKVKKGFWDYPQSQVERIINEATNIIIVYMVFWFVACAFAASMLLEMGFEELRSTLELLKTSSFSKPFITAETIVAIGAIGIRFIVTEWAKDTVIGGTAGLIACDLLLYFCAPELLAVTSSSLMLGIQIFLLCILLLKGSALAIKLVRWHRNEAKGKSLITFFESEDSDL